MKMMLKELSTSPQLHSYVRGLSVIRRICQVILTLWFLLSKVMDIDLKPSNSIGKNRKEGKDLLPGDNRSAVCKWIPEKREKEK